MYMIMPILNLLFATCTVIIELTEQTQHLSIYLNRRDVHFIMPAVAHMHP